MPRTKISSLIPPKETWLNLGKLAKGSLKRWGCGVGISVMTIPSTALVPFTFRANTAKGSLAKGHTHLLKKPFSRSP